jgi:hypothetical protein
VSNAQGPEDWGVFQGSPTYTSIPLSFSKVAQLGDSLWGPLWCFSPERLNMISTEQCPLGLSTGDSCKSGF